MAITIDDFAKVWASQSPLTPYEFSESQYKEGWNFIGGTPPSRQMWDFLQKQNDEKMKYLLNNFDDYAKKTDLDDYLPLSGGTLTGDVLGVTPPNGDNSKKLANTEFIQALASILVPVGVVQAYAGNTLPNGWLLCDGSAVSRTDYAALFAVIGTTYGAGDGTDTFNLPDLVDKFIQGNATSGTEHGAGLPNIKARLFAGVANAQGGLSIWYTPSGSGAFASQKTGIDVTLLSFSPGSGYMQSSDLTFDASRHNSIYKDDVSTVQPPSVTMRYIIKY